jgi:hypothetical protein
MEGLDSTIFLHMRGEEEGDLDFFVLLLVPCRGLSVIARAEVGEVQLWLVFAPPGSFLPPLGYVR